MRRGRLETPFRPRQAQLEDPVLEGGGRSLGRDSEGQEHLFAVLAIAPTGGQSHDVVLRLEANVARRHPRELRDEHHVIPLVKDVDHGLPRLVDHRPLTRLLHVAEGLDRRLSAAHPHREAVDGAHPLVVGLDLPRTLQCLPFFCEVGEEADEPAQPLDHGADSRRARLFAALLLLVHFRLQALHRASRQRLPAHRELPCIDSGRKCSSQGATDAAF